MSLYQELRDALTSQGFILRGGFQITQQDRADLGRSAETLVMIGNAGSAFWRHFAAAGTNGSNPMDAWTKETLTGFADIFGAQPLFPFEGPPYHPFQRWAQRCEPVYPSPVGPLIHPVFGLWHAYRGAFLFDQEMTLPKQPETPCPCETCEDKPCLTACPAGAFDKGSYDVPACVSHLKGEDQAECMALGCAARHACPIGQKYAYAPEQAQFHMEKFVRNNG